jgi:hypothetical protein
MGYRFMEGFDLGNFRLETQLYLRIPKSSTGDNALQSYTVFCLLLGYPITTASRPERLTRSRLRTPCSVQ